MGHSKLVNTLGRVTIDKKIDMNMSWSYDVDTQRDIHTVISRRTSRDLQFFYLYCTRIRKWNSKILKTINRAWKKGAPDNIILELHLFLRKASPFMEVTRLIRLGT